MTRNKIAEKRAQPETRSFAAPIRLHLKEYHKIGKMARCSEKQNQNAALHGFGLLEMKLEFAARRENQQWVG